MRRKIPRLRALAHSPSPEGSAAARRRPGGKRASAVIAAVAACVGLAAASASAAVVSPDEVSRGVTIPAFYDPPATLPSANGALVRTEPLPLGLSLPGLDGRPLPGTATRLMYKSTDSNGQPVAVTGAYIEPSAAWHGGGSRPLVAFASGTMGQGDQCAASMALQYPLILTGQTLSIGYDNLAIYRLLSSRRGGRRHRLRRPGRDRPAPHLRQPRRPGARPAGRGPRGARRAGSVDHRRLARRPVRLQPGRRQPAPRPPSCSLRTRPT